MKEITRIKELNTILNEARFAYEQENREIMSNFEYDKLYDELVELEKKIGFVLSSSPTINVGYEVMSEFPKEKHIVPMLSLDKTKDPEVLLEWLDNKVGLLSWKMDGLTVVLTYDKGELVKAVTRGNGEIGEVITSNAKVFDNVPVRIDFQGSVTVRGEAIITYSDFRKLNETIQDASARYKNPRNLCSGSVRQLDSKVTKSRHVKFYAFTLVNAEGCNFTHRREQFEWMKNQGFQTVEYCEVNHSTLKNAITDFSNRISANDFPSDGLVLTYDDISYGESLGRTAKSPRDSIAFKWKDETAETILRDVEWSASRTGLINPIAVFDPVELEGTTVCRASLHNVSILRQLNIGLGDKLVVYKANMIIPQIAENLTRSNSLEIPCKCPVCGHSTEIRNENGVETLFCTNPSCPAKQVKSFSHFVSRDAMNIEGLSETTLQKFIDRGFIRTFSDIFKLDEHRDEIINMEGFGEISYNNLISAVERAKHTTPEKLLYSLGIEGVGEVNAKLISKAANNDWNKIIILSESDLVAIPGVGNKLAQNIIRYFNNSDNLKNIEELLPFIIFDTVNDDESRIFEGLTFVITGSLNHFKNRKELEMIIENRGGKIGSSVSNNTSYLINNDIMSSSSKNKTAKKLSIPILTEDDFLNRFNITSTN